MTKRGIRLRLRPARQTPALKGQLPDLLARAAAGGLLSAPFHSPLTIGLQLCDAHLGRAGCAFLAPPRPAVLSPPAPSLPSARKRWLINSDRLAAGFRLTTMVPATF